MYGWFSNLPGISQCRNTGQIGKYALHKNETRPICMVHQDVGSELMVSVSRCAAHIGMANFPVCLESSSDRPTSDWKI